jgi:hypothetical protein|tara:strand:- start:280 stop:435 length:156 start_codon:yes stop_codon:yes gene_type:complete
MRSVDRQLFPGRLLCKFHTLKQMKAFLKRSKGINFKFWQAKIKKHIEIYGE